MIGLFACGQDHMDSGSMRRSDDPPREPIPTCATYAKAQCAALARCSAAPAQCEATLERECNPATAAWLASCVAWTEATTTCPFDRNAGACRR